MASPSGLEHNIAWGGTKSRHGFGTETKDRTRINGSRLVSRTAFNGAAVFQLGIETLLAKAAAVDTPEAWQAVRMLASEEALH